jgi:hypothetical protein
MKIFTLLFHILKSLTANIGRLLSFYTPGFTSPVNQPKPMFMQGFFATIKKIFTVTDNRNTIPANEKPVVATVCCCTTGTNNKFPNNFNHDVAQPAASFVFKPSAMNKSEKMSLLESLVRKCGVMVIAMLIANLFFVSHANAQATRTWLPTTGGSWTTTTNWSGGAIPVAGDNVIISSAQSAAITNVPTISLLNVTISANCNLTSASQPTLTITGALSVPAGVTVSLELGVHPLQE